MKLTQSLACLSSVSSNSYQLIANSYYVAPFVTRNYPFSIPTPRTLHWLLAFLLFLAVLASGAGVIRSHFPADSAPQFGSLAGSLAIIAFVISVHLWWKHVREVSR